MSASPLSLRGVFPPVPTHFSADGEVATEPLIENIGRWNQHDLAGYVVCGSNGEAPYLTMGEKRKVWEAARRAIPAAKLMIAGVGCESTRETIKLSREAAAAGADAALVITPHYFANRMSPKALRRHYRAVADASPVPVLLYTVPKFTQVDLDAATIAGLARHPNIAGVKDTSGNLAKMADTLRRIDPADGFSLLAGSAGFFLPALSVGAVGGILALAIVAPQACLEIYRRFNEGCLDEAGELQRRFTPLGAAVTSRYGVAGVKAAMEMLGYHGGPVRAPLEELTDPEREDLREVLDQSGLLGSDRVPGV